MSARASTDPASRAGAGSDAGAVRRRQLLLFSVIAAVVLAVLAVWLSAGGGGRPQAVGGIEAEIAGPDTAEKVWTRRSEARLGGIETQLREMRQEARNLRADNDRLRAKLETDGTDARAVIDRQAAMIDELDRRLRGPQPGSAPVPGASDAPGSDGYFRVPGARPQEGQPAAPSPAPAPMIETFKLEGEPRSSARDPRSGAELVADAVSKRVTTWLPAGAHAEAIVLAGVDASAGVSSQGDPRPVLLRITGPAWTAAPSGSGDGTAMQVGVDGCTVCSRPSATLLPMAKKCGLRDSGLSAPEAERPVPDAIRGPERPFRYRRRHRQRSRPGRR